MGVPIDCGQATHLNAVVSALVVYGASAVPLLAVAAFAVWRALIHARVARRYERLAAPASGASSPTRAMQGVVAIDDGAPFAARVELHQRGKTWTHKKRTYHSWAETGRTVAVRRFQLRLEDGTVVQVDGNQEALLCFPFSRATGDSDDRAIIAQLEAGQPVTVVGRVFERSGGPASSVYRGQAAPRTLMRAPARGRLVISTEPVARAFRRRMFLHIKWLAIAVGLFAVVHAVALSGYHTRVMSGETATATVTGKRAVRNGKSTSHYLNLRLSSGASIGEEDAWISCYDAVQPGDEVQVVLVPGHASMNQLGGSPTANLVYLILACAASAGGVLVYRRELRTKGPWYLRKRVDMRGDGPTNVNDLPEA